MSHTRAPRRKLIVPLAITASILSTLMLSWSLATTLSGFTAAVTTAGNTAGTSTLELSSYQSGYWCYSTAATKVISASNTTSNCVANQFGNSLNRVPGGSSFRTINVTNVGKSTANSLTLMFSTCTSGKINARGGSATDICAKTYANFQEDLSPGCAFPVSLTTKCPTVPASTALGVQGMVGTVYTISTTPWPPNETRNFTVRLSLDSTANNTYQGLDMYGTLVWTLNG